MSSFDENFSQLSQYFIKYSLSNESIEYAFYNFKNIGSPQPFFDLRVNEFNEIERRQTMTVHIQGKEAIYGNLVGDNLVSFFYALIVDYNSTQKTYTLSGLKQLDGPVNGEKTLVKVYNVNFNDIKARNRWWG